MHECEICGDLAPDDVEDPWHKPFPVIGAFCQVCARWVIEMEHSFDDYIYDGQLAAPQPLL